MTSKHIPIIAAFFMLASLAEAKPVDHLTEYWSLRNTWLEHLGEYIPVLKLTSGNSGDEQARLSARLESLQNKKLSNREWHEFWQEQSQYATALANHLNALSPEALEKKRRALHAKIQTLRTQQTNPKLIVAQKVDALRGEIRQLGQANSTLEDQVGRVRATLQKLATTASALEAKPNTTAIQQDRGRLAKAIADTEQKINRLSKTYQDNETRLLQKEQLLDVLANDPTSVAPDVLKEDGALKLAIDALKKDAETKTKAGSSETLERLKADIKNLDILRRNKVKERLFLKKWSRLSSEKTTNQDAYLSAIENELDAVSERLKTFKSKKVEAEASDKDEEPCRKSLRRKNTPFEQHRLCLAHLRETLEELNRREEQTELQHKMYEKLAATNLDLIKVQRNDVDLVRSEQELAQQAQQLLSHDPEWTQAWAEYAKRHDKKVGALEKALRESRKAKRELKAKTAVLSVMLERIASQRVEQGRKLSERSGIDDTIKAIALTVLSIIQVGWPALIYIIIAFIAVRLVRKFRDKKEKESEELDGGETHQLLAELEETLRKAEAESNEEEVMNLHEEIGRLESQLKDQGQRVATIARVAAQAVTLVIYVATGLLVLDALTVDIGPILGGAAIFGLAISFGSQSLVKDVVSGFFILLENQYAVGDVVTINGQSGTVEKVTLRRTVLRSMRGEVHNLTNGNISSVTNMTQGWARVVIDIGVAYGTDIEHVKEVVNQVGSEMYLDDEWRSKLTEKPAFVGVTAFGESEITVRAWCKTKTFQNWGVERELNVRLKSAFEAANIEIPFPKRDINVVVQASKEATTALGPAATAPPKD